MFRRRRSPRYVDGSCRCSFCGRTQKQAKKLLAGPGVYICDECIDLCTDILEEKRSLR